MDLQEYHAKFAGKSGWEAGALYQQLGMDMSKLIEDSIYYCCPIPVSRYGFSECLEKTKNDAIHPGVTPEMVAEFINFDWSGHLKRYKTKLIARYSRYNRINEVIPILLEHHVYRLTKDEKHISILCFSKTATANLCGTVMMDFDKFIFVTDIFAGNGYKNSIKFGIEIDYFWPGYESILDHCVDEFKKLCLEQIKVCG